jgi:peptidoglycan-N-acetylglucosamine deacetylase
MARCGGPVPKGQICRGVDLIGVSIAAIIVVCGLLYIPGPWLIGRWIRCCQRTTSQRNHQVYLTFDDGPGSRLTPQILDILRKNRIRASFFLLGRNIAGRETIVQRIQQEGHSIASHSYGHLHAWKVFPWQSLTDITRCWKILDNCLCQNNGRYHFRPPNGKLNALSLIYLLIRRTSIIYWSIDSGDTWSVGNRNPEYASNEIRKHGGGIVLFHDFDRSTDATDAFVLQSLESVIQVARQMNLQFATVDALS